MLKKIAIKILFIFCFSIVSTAQEMLPFVENFTKSIYNGDNQVWDVTQGNDNAMYFANNHFFLRYNGVKWEKYTLPNQTVIRAVFSHEDKIYCGSYNEFGFWKRENGVMIYRSLSQNKNLFRGISNNEEIWKIFEFDGKIYFQSFNELFILFNDRIEKIRIPFQISYCFPVKDKLYVASVNRGVFLLQNKKFTLVDGLKLDNTIILEFLEKNIDYGYTPFKWFSEQGKHRATADPVIVNFQKKFFLFSTNQEGYWWSDNMLNWNFVYRKFLLDNKYTHDLNAPGVFAMKDALYVYGSTHEKDFPIWKSSNPTKDEWKIAVDTLKVGAWDPAFLYDEEKDKLFLYWGSSNEFPLLGTELNSKTLQSDGYVKPIISLKPNDHGWERFGEYNDNTFLQPFMEGAWVTKYKNNYYFQYGAPATEFSGYADGVYVSENPLEGFNYQKHNPFSYKPGGFARGAGHGATYQDNYGNWWHTSTIILGQKNNFERRIGIWPSGFDKDDVMYCNTAYGDYPTLLPEFAKEKDFTKGLFSGWMLLNYNKPVQVSSTLGGNQANYAVDEDMRTYWSAKTGEKDEWFQTDLGEVATINAIQINYADQDVEFMGKTLGKFHQYKILASNDGKKWTTLVDKSQNKTDVPHDYIELEKPSKARYLKLENIKMPTGKFALSGFRIFGKGNGNAPKTVEKFVVLRADASKNGERRSSWIRWQQNPDADGYVIYFGKSPDKLYGSIMVYGKNDYFFTGMDRTDTYYFQIEAFNNNGVSKRTEISKSE